MGKTMIKIGMTIAVYGLSILLGEKALEFGGKLFK